MRPRRHIFLFLMLLSLCLLAQHRAARAQEISVEDLKVDSEEVMFGHVEQTLERYARRPDSETAESIERQLKSIRQTYPNTLRRDWVEEKLGQIQEALGEHSLRLAGFYFARGHTLMAAETRLQQIIREYPKFSRMDEAMLLLGKVYLANGQLKDGANYFWKLICRFPTSRSVNEAFEQLYQTGFDTSPGCNEVGQK